MAGKTLYQLLQVDPGAEPDVIVVAHRVLTRKLHPETDATGVAEYRLKELNRALAVLKDPVQREAYDRQLAAEEQRIAVGPGRGSYTLGDRIDAAAEDQRNLRIDFGRYAGWSLGDLLRTDPEYLRWLARHSSGIRYRRAILRLLDQHNARTPLRSARTGPE